MDPELRTWLTDRKLANKTLKILEKEDLTSVDVISLLKDDDLQELKTQHSMSVGQLIELRETRDALVHGELTQQHSTGLEHSSHEADNNVMPAEESDLVPVAAVSVCICSVQSPVCTPFKVYTVVLWLTVFIL